MGAVKLACNFCVLVALLAISFGITMWTLARLAKSVDPFFEESGGVGNMMSASTLTLLLNHNNTL